MNFNGFWPSRSRERTNWPKYAGIFNRISYTWSDFRCNPDQHVNFLISFAHILYFLWFSLQSWSKVSKLWQCLIIFKLFFVISNDFRCRPGRKGQNADDLSTQDGPQNGPKPTHDSAKRIPKMCFFRFGFAIDFGSIWDPFGRIFGAFGACPKSDKK